MIRTLTVTGALVALCLVGSGCTVEGQVRTAGYVSTPDLVLIEPGVYVVADYSYPVFYSDGYYWRYNNGFWLRSYTYNGGWTRTRTVPYVVRRIDRPTRYVHYRPTSRARVYRPPARRGGPPQRVEVRDHRDVRDRREVRDHRDDRNTNDRRTERRDTRPERREVNDHRAEQSRRDRDRDRDRNRDRDRDHDRDRDRHD